MIVPMIITGHTSHKDKHTIVDSRNRTINIIENVELCKRNNPNIEFYTIYSIDDTIDSQGYLGYFDKILYSDDIKHPYVGDKVKVEVGLNYIMSEEIKEWKCFIKTSSRTVLNNIEQYIAMVDRYDYIGKIHETVSQYSTAMFIGNKKLVGVWIDCDPKIDIAYSINTESDWYKLYSRNLLENLFFNCCIKHAVKSLLIHSLCIDKCIQN